jgi:hypothetical protein
VVASLAARGGGRVVLRFATFLSPEMFDAYAQMAAYAGRAVGAPVTLFVGQHDYDVFERGRADFGFI